MADLRQLPLPLPHAPPYATAEFLAAESNYEARTWLARTADWPARRLLLWGEAGVGKTHLLHVWARRTGALIIPGPALRGLPPAPDGPLAIDDADAPAEEAALFHLLNAAAEAGQPLLLAARTPAARWPVRLPDLASRVRAIAAVRIGEPEETLLDALLGTLLAQRSLHVEAEQQAWLRLHLPRAAGPLREFAARLDRAALAHGMRRPPRWLLCRIANDMSENPDDVLMSDPITHSPSDPALV